MIRVPGGAGAEDAHLARKMALGANAVAAIGRELRGIHDVRAACRMCIARAATPLATDAALAERRISVGRRRSSRRRVLRRDTHPSRAGRSAPPLRTR